MIPVEEAKEKLFGQVPEPGCTVIPVKEARGRNLYEDIIATIDLPLFSQSAMDGFALNLTSKEIKRENGFEVTAESRAGSGELQELLPGKAARIFTGAPVPGGTSTVVKQEDTRIKDGKLWISGEHLQNGQNIRLKGSQIRQGEKALDARTILTPAGTGFLSSLGITRVKVYNRPRAGIISTGDELKDPGKTLQPGQIYESNTPVLHSALEQMGIRSIKVKKAGDSMEATRQALNELLPECDVIMFSGGISVGAYDFVGRVFKEFDARELFYKVAQKPGKPLYAGLLDKTLLFGLPGNPAATLTCFYEYVLPCLRKMQGIRKYGLPQTKQPLLNPLSLKEGRAHFLKARTESEGVRVLDGQPSYIMKTFAEANVLVYIPQGTGKLETGQLVEVHHLPTGSY